MPLFLPFRRAGIHEKIFQAVLFPALGALALVVLAPFVFMVALSLADPTDWFEQRKWPKLSHLADSKRMYVYYLASRYDYWGGIAGFDGFYGTEGKTSPTILNLPEAPVPAGNWRQRAEDGLDCLTTRIPWTHAQVLFTAWVYFRADAPITAYTGLGEEAWKKHLRKKYRDISTVNRAFESEFLSFGHVQVPELPNPNIREGYALDNPWLLEYREFLTRGVRQSWRIPRMGTRYWRAYLESKPEIGKDLAKLNAALSTSYTGWAEARLPEKVPATPALRKYWEEYVRTVVNPYYLAIELVPATTVLFKKFLRSRYGSADRIYELYGSSSDSVPLPATAHEITTSATAFYDWDAFARTLPAELIRINSCESVWHGYLREKYGGDAARMNQAWGTAHGAIDDAPWPQPEIDRLDWTRHRLQYVGEVVFKNYRRAWNLVTITTPALWNTAVFTVLFTLLSIAINTFAGYALSRYALGPAQMFLVGFLALAAFPVEAIAVPNFLLLREIGILNTVWALVLPTTLNGYYIYLMKSVFDSIPRNFIEEADMEGPGEWQMFRVVMLPFARPMLAVVALYAFLFAYSNFLWALIVCQQRSQWIMPVFMFAANSWFLPPQLLGALMVMSILPPLVIFVFAHRTLQHSLTLPR